MELEEYVGNWGWGQALVYLVAGMAPFISGSQIMAFVFTAAVPESRCFIPGVDDKAVGFNDSGTATFNNPDVLSRLPVYYYAGTNETVTNNCRYCVRWINDSQYDPIPCTIDSTRECDSGLLYSRWPIRSSLVERFNMTCARNGWKRQLLPSLTMTGVMFGALTGGTLSDRFGRRPIITIFAIIGIGVYHLMPFAPSYWLFCILQFLVGFCCSASGVVAYCATMEINGGLARTIAGVWWQGFFTAGYLYVGVVAFFIRDWQYIQLAVAVPSLLMVPTMVLVIPESVRWLLVRGERERALRTVRWLARLNRIDLNEERLRMFLCRESKKGEATERSSFAKLCHYPEVLRNALIVFYLWFGCSMTYYGLSLNTSYLPGNLYVNYFITGLVELPGFFIAVPMMEKMGRRKTIIIFLGFGGVAVIICSLLPSGLSPLIVSLASIGKLGAAAGFAVAYNYAIEVFPTEMRSTGVGLASASSRVAAILSPQIAQLGIYVMPWVPFVVYGSVAASSAFFMIFAPETAHQPLLQTIEETVAATKNAAQLVESTDPSLSEPLKQVELDALAEC